MYIQDKCDLLNAQQTIAYAAIQFTHKIITKKLPESNYLMYLPPNKRTQHNTVGTTIRPKTKKLKQHIVHKGPDLTNNILTHIKLLPHKKFSKQLKLHIVANNTWDPGED